MAQKKSKDSDPSTSLNNQLQKYEKELMDLRFEYASARSLSTPSRVKTTRKNIARIHTQILDLNKKGKDK